MPINTIIAVIAILVLLCIIAVLVLLRWSVRTRSRRCATMFGLYLACVSDGRCFLMHSHYTLEVRLSCLIVCYEGKSYHKLPRSSGITEKKMLRECNM